MSWRTTWSVEIVIVARLVAKQLTVVQHFLNSREAPVPEVERPPIDTVVSIPVSLAN